MTFDELLAQIRDLLQREQRLSYRALKVRFHLDDDHLEALKEEIIYAKRLAVDEDGRVLVWAGVADLAAAPSPRPASPAMPDQERAPRAYTPPHLVEKILTARRDLEGERKQVTVLFADIKDSTELIRGLDPEAAQQLLDPALHRMMDAVHRFAGTVNQVLGDGIMALFGAPIAHEDHALRACYAALAMQAAMQAYTDEVRRAHGLELRIRVGLNAGEVVGRAIGNDLHMDYSAVGETTVLAARMEQSATPGSVRLPAGTLRLVEGLVRVQALGPVPVKGLAEPVEVYELLGASALRGRLQAAVARGLTRFVGRETEMVALAQACEQAGMGHGQVVAAVGEAGVGKSRLLYEFVHSHRTQGWLVLEAASVSYGKATPYFPVVELLKRYVQVEDGDEPRTVRARVTGHLLTLDEALQDTIPALLALLEALPADSLFLRLDPPQRRQRTLTALKRVLLRESQVQPLLLVCEDLHWIDTETQALLDSLVESLPTAQLLLLVNYRPEYQHGWGSKTYYTQLRLDPLPPASADALLQALLGDAPSLAPLTRLLIARTEGNPFFLEESVRTLVETGVLVGAPGAYRLVKPLESLQVPATVLAVLAARIDRLPPEDKRLLQTAAVIGTEVPLPLLQAIAELPEAALLSTLLHLPEQRHTREQAVDLRLALRTALLPSGDFGRILAALREAESLAELLDDPRRSGQLSAFLSNHFRNMGVYDQAIASGQRALALATAGGEGVLQVLANFYLGNAYHVQGDYRQAIACYRQAGASLDEAQHRERFGQVMLPAVQSRAHLAACHAELGTFAEGRALGEEGLRIAETVDHPASLMRASLGIGLLFLRQGDLYRALPRLERAVGICQDADLPVFFPQVALALGVAYTLGGRIADAVPLLTQAIEQTMATGMVFCQTPCYHSLGKAHLLAGRFEDAQALAERALALAHERQERSDQAYALRLLGEIAAHRAPPHVDAAAAHYRQALALAEALGMRPLQAHCHHALGTLFAQTGQQEQACAALATAIEMYRGMDMTFWLPQAEAALAQVG
jgi:class 3 adenylate cyclase/tetratricopeptide (TPR) repeat protein